VSRNRLLTQRACLPPQSALPFLTQCILPQYSSSVYPGLVPSQLPLALRTQRHGALSDPIRLAVIDELGSSDRSPQELQRLTGTASNLLAHHLDILEDAGLITRSRSSGDGRRRYVQLQHQALTELMARPHVVATRTMFVCTRNSARSQLAAAMWRQLTGTPAESAGTHPADRVDPGAVAAALRAGIPLGSSRPRLLDLKDATAPMVVTVCDQAREELRPDPTWLHWSVPDPVPVGTDAAFDATVAELRQRIATLVDMSEGQR
jgi:ArsR family transcriptional regulator, arsenate/arsenite/antimonite-responsive transcriptional repressor / arsenate reductase (thioredoxin)